MTVSCAEGDTGYVYADILRLECEKLGVDTHADLQAESDDGRR
ncbi:hypothetical protein ACNKHS_09025 [Shigella flexneri]